MVGNADNEVGFLGLVPCPGGGGNSARSGAWHGSELTFVFGTTEEVTGVANDLVEKEVERYVMGSWAGFAKNPNEALEKLGWPRYNATGTCSLFH